jgi:nitrile hydratase
VNGIHDMGGMHGMGPINPEKNEPVFHAAWEGRAFALSMAVDGDWPYGADRYQIELIPPADAPELLREMGDEPGRMLKAGMLPWAEIASGRKGELRTKKGHGLTAPEMPAMIAAGDPATRNVPTAPLFLAGQRVRARNMHPVGRTRLPRYARGKIGTIQLDYGVFEFPDSSARGLAKNRSTCIRHASPPVGRAGQSARFCVR